MYIRIDFNSDDALYIQIRDQIICGIASSAYQEGDSLPSVRELAEVIGINMHTVNKAYTILKQEGYLKLDRRKGAVIAVNCNKLNSLNEMKEELKTVIAKAICRNISSVEMHEVIEQIYGEFEGR
ncbi:MAG TPA: GntR family transcriptional regulator [Clostridiales bacterium]|nr:GntR family transcriptional regulator [Clostridiales bacterium]